MVSLEQKMNYLSRVAESPKLQAFYCLLLRQPFSSGNERLNEIDQIYFGLLNAIQDNNQQEFDKYYTRKSKSNPTKDSPSPFVNDDFLIFAIVVGVCKFSYNRDWIKSIISIRTRSSVTITFENILSENYYSKSCLPEVVFMYLLLCRDTLITSDFINFTFKTINENTTLFQSRSDFQIICSLQAYEAIILRKETSNTVELELLNRFEHRFAKRVKILSWTLQAFLFFGLIYLLLKLPTYSPEAVSLIDKYSYAFTILGGLGFTLLGNLIPFFRNISEKLIKRALGYPKELENKSIQK